MSTQTSGLYAPYERLIKITVLGKTAEVPENNILLRGFQFVNPNTIPYGRFCWNEECQYCRVVVVGMDGRPRTVLSCKVLVREGMGNPLGGAGIGPSPEERPEFGDVRGAAGHRPKKKRTSAVKRPLPCAWSAASPAPCAVASCLARLVEEVVRTPGDETQAKKRSAGGGW